MLKTNWGFWPNTKAAVRLRFILVNIFYNSVLFSFGNNVVLRSNSNHSFFFLSISLYNLKLIFLPQSVQASRILIEKFSSESKESVVTLNQHSRKGLRVCIFFILNFELVALSACSSDIISSNLRNYFLVLFESRKCLRTFTVVTATATLDYSYLFMSLCFLRTYFLFFKYVFMTLRKR